MTAIDLTDAERELIELLRALTGELRLAITCNPEGFEIIMLPEIDAECRGVGSNFDEAWADLSVEAVEQPSDVVLEAPAKGTVVRFPPRLRVVKDEGSGS